MQVRKAEMYNKLVSKVKLHSREMHIIVGLRNIVVSTYSILENIFQPEQTSSLVRVEYFSHQVKAKLNNPHTLTIIP